MTHDFLSIYDAKALEYLLALAYLCIFPFYWSFVSGKPAPKKVREPFRFRVHLPALRHSHSEARS